MDLGSRMPRARCALVGGVTSLTALVLVYGLLEPAADGFATVDGGTVATTGFAPLLVSGCAAVGIVVTGWLWLVAMVVVVDAWRGVVPARRGIPVGVRRLTLALCGVALTGLPTPVLAAGGQATPGTPPSLSGLRLPERVSVPLLPHADQAAPGRAEHQAPHRQVVVVKVGDTLWAITAAELGPGASDAETARAWPAIYALNRAVIGDDPGRIEPGQRLVLPSGDGPGKHDGSSR